MQANSRTKEMIPEARPYMDVADLRLVNSMRLTLAVSVLMAVFINPSGLSAEQSYCWLVFYGYFFYSVLIYAMTLSRHRFAWTVLPHRIDVLWFSIIVALTGGVDSFFFLFFFFSILTSSFRWGYEEGAKVTIASALLFVLCGWLLAEKDDLSRLLLRATFLLAIGIVSVYWGESKVRLMHQLVLLREVSRLSNPRFGVSQTIANILDKTRQFFGASSCMLVMQDKEAGSYFLRTVDENTGIRHVSEQPVNSELASLLLSQSPHQLVAYSDSNGGLNRFFQSEPLVYDCTAQRWIKPEGHSSKALTDLLGARSFMSTPVSLRKQYGRLYVVSDGGAFNRDDALFLHHIVTQSFPVIDNIDCLEKMASNAASDERQKLAMDIHDRTIQPYIGLKLALSAIKSKASLDNPLVPDIDKLAAMAETVLTDLRHYALTFSTRAQQDKSMFHAALQKESTRISELYGIEISITVEHELELNDRLAVELLHFVHEGLSNICRHTLSSRGSVSINYIHDQIKILIKNPSPLSPPVKFLPKSIHDRAMRLGGSVDVMQESDGATVVHIEIPV